MERAYISEPRDVISDGQARHCTNSGMGGVAAAENTERPNPFMVHEDRAVVGSEHDTLLLERAGRCELELVDFS